MSDTTTEHLSAGQLAEQAAHAIRELIHRTHPTGDDLVYPADTATIIATLAHMTGMLPQLLAQLTRWLTHQHQDGRLTPDSLEARPGLAPTMHTLTDSLQHAIAHAQHTAAELDTAHQHAAHLAAAEPATNYQAPNTKCPGPKFMQISGAKPLDETHSRPKNAVTSASIAICSSNSAPSRATSSIAPAQILAAGEHPIYFFLQPLRRR